MFKIEKSAKNFLPYKISTSNFQFSIFLTHDGAFLTINQIINIYNKKNRNFALLFRGENNEVFARIYLKNKK